MDNPSRAVIHGPLKVDGLSHSQGPPNSEQQKFQNLTNSPNSEETEQLEPSEQRIGPNTSFCPSSSNRPKFGRRTAHFERTARTPNSPNTKNFENFRTGRTVRTPTIRTLVDPAHSRQFRGYGDGPTSNWAVLCCPLYAVLERLLVNFRLF